MTRVPPMKCRDHGIPECHECKGAPKIKPHGPVGEQVMSGFYGPAHSAASAAARDAYEGCREDLLDWKRRALAAEAKVRELEATCGNLSRALGEEVNGWTFMGEPFRQQR